MQNTWKLKIGKKGIVKTDTRGRLRSYLETVDYSALFLPFVVLAKPAWAAPNLFGKSAIADPGDPSPGWSAYQGDIARDTWISSIAGAASCLTTSKKGGNANQQFSRLAGRSILLKTHAQAAEGGRRMPMVVIHPWAHTLDPLMATSRRLLFLPKESKRLRQSDRFRFPEIKTNIENNN